MRELVEAGHYRRHCKGYVKNPGTKDY